VFPSLAFDRDGDPAIAYEPNGPLRYASWNGMAWDIETVSPDLAVIPSLAFDAAGVPSPGYAAFDVCCRPPGVIHYARRSGSSWYTERVDEFYTRGVVSSLVVDARGHPLMSAGSSCASSPRLARKTLAGVLHRAEVADLSAGWKSAALPLSDLNDDETPPFPVDTVLGLATDDAIVATGPLTFYRLLLAGGVDAGNLLRVTRRSGIVELRY